MSDWMVMIVFTAIALLAAVALILKSNADEATSNGEGSPSLVPHNNRHVKSTAG